MILVTGASGLLGANVISHARELGREVAGLHHRHPLHLNGTRMYGVDLTDQASTRDLVTRLKPTCIIHCAAATNVDWCEEHSAEAEQINVRASALLAGIARGLNASFVYVSTDAVFDGKQGNYTENHPPAPVNTYGRSKLEGEREVLKEYPSALVVRVNIYGWNAQNKFSLAEWILNELTQGNPVPGFTDVHFTPILVNDLAEVLLTMLDLGLHGLYHVAGSETISKFEFARRLAACFGFDPSRVVPASSHDVGLKALRPSDISLNTRKAASAVGRSMPDVSAGLAKFRALRESGYPQKLKSYLRGATQ